jgi:hypothetical protein
MASRVATTEAASFQASLRDTSFSTRVTPALKSRAKSIQSLRDEIKDSFIK